MNDQARALLLVGALLSGASSSAGFVGGRMTAPVAPPEVRFVHVPPAATLAPPAEATPLETQPVAVEPAPKVAPPIVSPPAEVKPLPVPRPRVEAKPKAQPTPERETPAKKPRARSANRALPSCAVIKREYEGMTWPQRMAAYRRATPEQVAYGQRCRSLLGF